MIEIFAIESCEIGFVMLFHKRHRVHLPNTMILGEPHNIKFCILRSGTKPVGNGWHSYNRDINIARHHLVDELSSRCIAKLDLETGNFLAQLINDPDQPRWADGTNDFQFQWRRIPMLSH